MRQEIILGLGVASQFVRIVPEADIHIQADTTVS